MNNVKMRANGWRSYETELLLSEAANAKQTNKPLKSVFTQVADALKRQPNSVRNYYYQLAREMELSGKSNFIPFEQDEVYDLVKDVLIAQANGESVRGCTLRLGKDKTNMLRLQNKYRSVIKNAQPMVEQIMRELDAQGVKYFNPYMEKPARGRRAGATQSTNRRELERLIEENKQLKLLNNSLNAELVKTRARLNQVMGMFNQLMSINREFMDNNSSAVI